MTESSVNNHSGILDVQGKALKAHPGVSRRLFCAAGALTLPCAPLLAAQNPFSAPLSPSTTAAAPGASTEIPSALRTLPYPITSTPPSVWDLWLVRRSTGQEYREAYVIDNSVHMPGYIKLCQALRDVRAPSSEQTVQMDLQLLNLLFAVQQWLKINNAYRPLLINSGYRTIANNNRLENAARNSMHLYGKAADFFIEGLPNRYLSDLVGRFQQGGTGLYLDSGFVHADTGRLRRWRG